MLLTNTEPSLLRPILPSDPVPAPFDSSLESLTIPTPNQMMAQSQTIEPTPDETVSDSPNHESTATETHDIAQHPQVSINNYHTSFEIERPSNWHLMSGITKNNWRKKQKNQKEWGSRG